MKKPVFSLLEKDKALLELIGQTGHKTLAIWAKDCAGRVLPYFEKEHPGDQRPRQALETLQTWIDTGEFKMVVIRGASLAAHAAAREVEQDNPARSAARAAGQAVASTHVARHSIAAANYALQAIHRASGDDRAQAAVSRERDWQVQRLLALRKSSQLQE